MTANVVEGYVGLFTALSGLHFGYAHFRYDDPNNTITLLDYSYEDSPGVGLTVTAVPVPEPGTWALALLGLAVVANKARRIKSAA